LIAGWHADVLRAVGCFLDQSDAGTYSIVIDVDEMNVVWNGADPAIRHRAYLQHELDELRAQARALRHGNGAATGPNSELLRTIGQDLDRDGVTLRGIFRNAEGFGVSGLVVPGYFYALYLTQDVIALSVSRQSARGKIPPASPPR
jgi:hypothetical protein